jgi:hypothetical protein
MLRIIDKQKIKSNFQKTYVDRVVQHLIEVMIPANPNGFTFAPMDYGCPVFNDSVYPDIYFVSINGAEKVFSSVPSYQEVSTWVQNNYGWLCIVGNYIGYWRHLKTFYLDITKAIVGQSCALAFGKLNRQHSIYHPYTQTTIPIEYNSTKIALSGIPNPTIYNMPAIVLGAGI